MKLETRNHGSGWLRAKALRLGISERGFSPFPVESGPARVLASVGAKRLDCARLQRRFDWHRCKNAGQPGALQTLREARDRGFALTFSIPSKLPRHALLRCRAFNPQPVGFKIRILDFGFRISSQGLAA